MNTSSRTTVVMNYVLLTICAIVAIYPLVGVFLASLYPTGPGSSPSGFGLPPTFEWHNYVTAWEQGLKEPSGMGLKLLNIVERKGIGALG